MNDHDNDKLSQNQANDKTPRFPLRARCECGSERGSLSRSGPHIKVSCAECGRFAFFAPKHSLLARGIHPDMIGAELSSEPQTASPFDLSKKEVP